MRTFKTGRLNAEKKDEYLELILQYPLKPIATEAGHAEAIRRLAMLDGRVVPLTSNEMEYTDALAILIKDYEARNHCLGLYEKDPMEILKHLMAERKMSVNDLGKVIGSQSSASQVLAGKRQLSKTHIRKLADYFQVNAGLFL